MNVLNTFSLKGKVALVTGGSGLYGKQMVRAMAEAGATTYTASRNIDKLTEFTEKLKSEGLLATPLTYDQSSLDSITELRDEIIKRSGKIDILINNSVYRSGPVEELTEENANIDFGINATGIIMMCREFGKVMAEQGSGSVINIGSIYGLVGYDDWLYEGTGLKESEAINDLIGWEYHGFPAMELPGMEVLAYSPITHPNGNPLPPHVATMYNGAKGNVVFNAGTIWFAQKLSSPPGHVLPSWGAQISGPDPRIQRMTENLLKRFLQ